MKSQADWQQTLDTVEDLRTLVRTMKALSAVSIRQYDTALQSLSRYRVTLDLAFKAWLQKHTTQPDSNNGYQTGEPIGAIVFGSDQGLCGRFNEAIVEHALDSMNGLQVALTDRHWLLIGSRLQGLLENHGVSIQHVFEQPASAATIGRLVEKLAIEIEKWTQHSGIRHVVLFYNRHTIDSAHKPCQYRLLPVDFQHFQRMASTPWPARGLPVFRMPGDALFAQLLRQHLYVTLFRANAESLASEHVSRLQSMQGAERNIEERLQDLAAEYQRSRQTAITEEMLDVLNGFEASKGDRAF